MIRIIWSVSSVQSALGSDLRYSGQSNSCKFVDPQMDLDEEVDWNSVRRPRASPRALPKITPRILSFNSDGLRPGTDGIERDSRIVLESFVVLRENIIFCQGRLGLSV